MTHSVSWAEIAEILEQHDDYESIREALERHAPKPTHPERLLGVWAKHPEFGDVFICDDVPIESCVVVVCRDSEKAAGSS
ncbi:hypothetical protein GR239_37495, partial [Rhizobium leguminosarum]|uniref:hypothetical protein n=1 Tax=Rhizobium ruizarguesonis TaxID=2081791 RepID=UPI0013BDBB1D